MIFKEIHIDGFGIFNRFSLNNLKQGINIIIGNNEVGKSTLLKFLRFTLFGYPRFKDQRMFPVNGGNHGGRIKAILSSNKEVIFERTGDDQISFHYEGESLKNQSQWFQFLGNATKEIFENVYAFSLAELVDIESLSSSGVEDKIFSIGSGLGNISIGDILTDIQGKIDRIYSPRGSKQLIPSILKDIHSKKTHILEIQNNLPIYQDFTNQIKQHENELIDIKNQLKDKRAGKEKMDNYLKCYENFVSIIKIEEELETLPKLQNYPNDSIERLKDLEKEEQELKNKVQELQKGSEDKKGIEEMEGSITSISFNNELLTKADNVDYLKTNLEKYKQTIADKAENEQKIKNLDITIRKELKNISSKWTEQNIAEFSDIITHKDRIKYFKEKFDEIENNKRDLVAQQKAVQAKESSVNIKNVFIILSLIFIFGAIPAFYYSLYVLGSICLIIALMLFYSRKYLIKESLLEKVQKQLSELSDKEKEVKNNYKEYLDKALNLENSLSIDSVLEIFRIILQLKKEINEKDELKTKQENLRIQFIQQFEEEVKSTQIFLELKGNFENIEFSVNQITKEYDLAKQLSQERENLQNSLIVARKEFKRIEERLENNDKQINNLLESIEVRNREDFRKKHDQNNRVKDLVEKRGSAVMTIETIVGLNKSDEVIDFLKNKERQDLTEEVKNLEEEILGMSEDLNNKNKELGEKKNEIKRIEGESDLAEIMTELESERQKLYNAYKEWITGKIALRLLTEVKEKYEKEKQPVVIKNSSTYLDKITAERYKRISVSLDESNIVIFDSREAAKNIDQLSRGTKEQLLISLRLGFIEEYETKAEPLPVIVDEVLVNFDPNRAKKVAEIFQEFGANRQILIFTCHPSTIEYFDRSSINLIELKTKN